MKNAARARKRDDKSRHWEGSIFFCSCPILREKHREKRVGGETTVARLSGFICIFARKYVAVCGRRIN